MITPTPIIETHIINLVELNAGLKGVELITRLMSYDLIINRNMLMDIIFDMIERGDLVELEMILPNNTSKSFLLPKGTKINVIKKR